MHASERYRWQDHEPHPGRMEFQNKAAVGLALIRATKRGGFLDNKGVPRGTNGSYIACHSNSRLHALSAKKPETQTDRLIAFSL